MRIEYRKDDTKRANTWFAKIRRSDTQWLQNKFQEYINIGAQFSVEPRSDVWETFSLGHKERYGKAGYHQGKANTILSVLAGAQKKFNEGGDLTAKQLQQVQNAFEDLNKLSPDVFESVEFVEVEQYSNTGNRLEDLRQKLFE